MFLVNLSSLQLGGITPKIIDFPNKEFKMVLEEIPHEEPVAIVVQTDLDPTRMIFATAMLVEIVSKHNPKRIIVVHPWLSFSRQDRRLLPGEPQSLEMILSWYAAIGVTDIIAFDIHAVQYRVPGKHRWNEKLTNDQVFDEMAVVFHRAIEDQNRKPKYNIGSRLVTAAESQKPGTATGTV